MRAGVQALPIATEIFQAGWNLTDFVLRHAGAHDFEGKILAVTSKIVSLAEHAVVPKKANDKETLVRREADHFLGAIGYGCFLTIKHGLFIASAGIDESNAQGDEYILFPKDPFASALRLQRELREAWRLKNFGVLLTDSHTTPMRAGVTGISLAHAGFCGIQNMVGQPDLFGRPLKMTRINAADALAAAAVFCMGEGGEGTPLAWMEADVDFAVQSDHRHECQMPVEQDMYYPLYKNHVGRGDSEV